MNNRVLINLLLAIAGIGLFVIAYLMANPAYSQIFNILGVVISFLAIKRIFNIKAFATKE